MSNPALGPPRARTPWGRAIALPAALAAVAALVGCTAVGPDFKAAELDAPARWSDRHGGARALAAPPQSAAALPVDR